MPTLSSYHGQWNGHRECRTLFTEPSGFGPVLRNVAHVSTRIRYCSITRRLASAGTLRGVSVTHVPKLKGFGMAKQSQLRKRQGRS